MKIYQIRNIVNDKIYVGSAVNFPNRKSQHLCLLRKNKHPNQHIQNSWNKHQEHDFVFELLEHVDDKQKLIEREQFYIDTLIPEFNIHRIAGSRTTGRWVELYDETEADIRFLKYKETHKGLHAGENHGMFGKTHTDKVKKKLSLLASSRVGEKANRYVNVDMNQLQTLVNQKLSIKEIAKIMNLSIFIVSKRIKAI